MSNTIGYDKQPIQMPYERDGQIMERPEGKEVPQDEVNWHEILAQEITPGIDTAHIGRICDLLTERSSEPQFIELARYLFDGCIGMTIPRKDGQSAGVALRLKEHLVLSFPRRPGSTQPDAYTPGHPWVAAQAPTDGKAAVWWVSMALELFKLFDSNKVPHPACGVRIEHGVCTHKHLTRWCLECRRFTCWLHPRQGNEETGYFHGLTPCAEPTNTGPRGDMRLTLRVVELIHCAAAAPGQAVPDEIATMRRLGSYLNDLREAISWALDVPPALHWLDTLIKEREDGILWIRPEPLTWIRDHLPGAPVKPEVDLATRRTASTAPLVGEPGEAFLGSWKAACLSHLNDAEGRARGGWWHLKPEDRPALQWRDYIVACSWLLDRVHPFDDVLRLPPPDTLTDRSSDPQNAIDDDKSPEEDESLRDQILDYLKVSIEAMPNLTLPQAPHTWAAEYFTLFEQACSNLQARFTELVTLVRTGTSDPQKVKKQLPHIHTLEHDYDLLRDAVLEIEGTPYALLSLCRQLDIPGSEPTSTNEEVRND